MGMKRTRTLLVLAVVGCLVLALAGQAATDRLVTGSAGEDTTEAVGRAASSYLTGIRVFVAAVVWNRIDPLMHNYYSGVGLSDQRYMLSTIALVEALDPTFVQSYYVGSWILVRNDRVADGLDMAARGVEKNPTSGLLYANLAQLQLLYGQDLEAALATAKAALGSDVEWESASDQYTAYAEFRDVFDAAGEVTLSESMSEELTRLDAEIEANPDEADHDHDHDNDGVPDH